MIDFEQVNWATVLLSAVVAIFTGAAGGYYSQKFTDKRRAKENRLKSKQLFVKTVSEMPELILVMKTYLIENKLIRKFMHHGGAPPKILQNERKDYCFVLFECDAYPNLEQKVELLEAREYIFRTGEHFGPLYGVVYQMEEDFVEHILAWQPPKDKK